MFSLISGVALTGAGGATLWYLMPKNGVPHPLTTKPLASSLLPITIMIMIVMGIAMVISSLT